MKIKVFLKNLIAFTASLKTTISILTFMTVTFTLSALFGKIIPSLGDNIFYNLLIFLGLNDDIFNSWWFIFLLSLFSLNLLTCSLTRIPHTLKVLKLSKEICSEDFINDKLLMKEWRWKNFKPQSTKWLIKAMSMQFNKPLIEYGINGLKLFAEKGKYSHFGFYLAHLGIPIVILGGILNSFGYQGSIEIAKGEVSDTLILKRSPEILSKRLGFSIRCDDYKKIYHERTNKIKNHQSTLTILENNKKIKTETIDFSRPLKYRGVHIYQTLSGHVSDEGSEEEISLYVLPKKESRRGKIYPVKLGDSFEIEGTGHIIKANKFSSNYILEDVSGTRTNVPAVELMILDGNKKSYQGWVSAGSFDKKSESYSIFFLPQTRKNSTYTRLKISKKPGEQLIWLGFIAMIIGFGISFFIPHRRIWLQVIERDGTHYVTLAGATTKNLKSFEKDFGELCQNIFSSTS